MEKQNMPEIKVLTTKEGFAKIEIWHGQLETPPQPTCTEIKGAINAPSLWWEDKKIKYRDDKQGDERQNCHIVYQYNPIPTIKLICDEASAYRDIIVGQLLLNPALLEFGIFGTVTTPKTFSQDGLVMLLKRYRHLFATPDENKSLIHALVNFKAEFKENIDKTKDFRGNSSNINNKNFSGNIPNTFVLYMPVFVGQLPSKFEVEIYFEKRDAGISIWLESPELLKIKEDNAKSIVDEELIKMAELVKIETTDNI